MNKIFVLGLIILPFYVQAASEGWKNCDDEGTAPCEYQIKDGVLTIRGTGENGAGIIPDYGRDCPENADCQTKSPFRWDKDAPTVHTVNVEKGITSVGEWAFEDMTFITANLPEGLISLQAGAFHQCVYLSNINLPDSLTQIEGWALAPTNITALKLPSNLKTIGGYAFDVGSLTDSFLVIPDSVTSLPEDAFYSYVPQPHLSKLYCSALLIEACEKAAAKAGFKAFEYVKNQDGRYVVNNTLYLSLSDMQKGKIFVPKRIYTIDEANAVAGAKNRVSIKYR